jgi:hypothetical protein
LLPPSSSDDDDDGDPSPDASPKVMLLPHHDQDLLSCTNLFQYGIEIFIPDIFAFNLSAPELGPNTGENVFFEYNAMQSIQ